MATRNAPAPAGSQDFSVIVTTFDDPASLRLVLCALGVQSLQPREVIVADDGSSPETAAMLDKAAADFRFALFHVRQPHDGFRAARSRNNGIAAASCPNLAFLDQDTLPHPDWLQTHAAALASSRVCLGACLNLMPERKADLTPVSVCQGEFTTWHTARDERRLRRFHAKSCAYALGRRIGFRFRSRPSLRSQNFAVRKSDVELVNGFDESFIGWGQEDDNLGRRLYMAGIRPVVLFRQARATHIPHPRRDTASRLAGANIARHKAEITDFRAKQGLDGRPYADVTIHEPGKPRRPR